MASQEQASPEVGHVWYARPVLFVEDIARAIEFYRDGLGFEKKWHSGDGDGTVCQVQRGGCELILCEDAGRKDRGRLFIELTPEGLRAFRSDIDRNSVPSRPSWWGYDVIAVADPDGNELLFPFE
jgi:catechol 2,3-dioxygenase-like lactoylglutathione lyase family enzyme